eukprot:164986_1
MYARQKQFILLIFFVFLINNINCKTWNILNYGAIPSNKNIPICNSNTKIITQLLNNQLKSGDLLLIPSGNDFWFNGGIYASIHNITIQIDGSINYQNKRKYWPTQNNSDHVLEAMRFDNSNNITFTSSNKINKGLINGNGNKWWGLTQYCIHSENRPRLLHIYNSTNILIQYIYFKNSPYWTVYLEDIKNVEIHHSNVSARRDNRNYHNLYDITAFNTDGFDVSGENVWIHDVEIWNDDDCIAVKKQDATSYQSKCSQNMLFENINASGIGLTIGSISPKNNRCVNNITFRNIYMYHTWKGIYMKSAPGNGIGTISNILYENITMDRPTGVPIWIGPQQAGYHDQCSLLWPQIPFSKCPVTAEITWSNITLKNILINNPKQSPGVILGNISNPMMNILFDNVVVNNPGKKPWGDKFYDCIGVKNFQYVDGTKPVPPCDDGVYLNYTYDESWWESFPGYDEYKELMECLESKIEGVNDKNVNVNVMGGERVNRNGHGILNKYKLNAGFIMMVLVFFVLLAVRMILRWRQIKRRKVMVNMPINIKLIR